MSGLKGLTTGQEQHVKTIISNEVGKVNADVKKVNWLMGAVILVLFVGFLALLFSLGALILQAWEYTLPSYQSLNASINTLNNELQKQGTTAIFH